MNLERVAEFEKTIKTDYSNTAGIVVLKEGQVRYEIICQACGTRYKRIRRSRFVVEVLENPDQPTSYRCHCGCRFFQCLQCNVPQKTRGENE